jgi:hypothetical protein
MTTETIKTGIVNGEQLDKLEVGTKVRVLALDPRDGFYPHRDHFIGDDELFLEVVLASISPTFHSNKRVHIYPAGTSICFLNLSGNIFEIINEEMPIAKKTTRGRKAGTAISVRTPVKRRSKASIATTTGGWVTLDDCFKVPKGIHDILKRNIDKSVNTMLLGATGVGKTELAAKIAWGLGKEVHIFDMGTMTDPITGLVGSHIIYVKDGKTVSEFRKSRFSEVIQKECVVILDEISRASAQANNLLFPCLDFRKELAMEYCFDDTTPIKVHDKCVFIATANLGSQYTGTHKLDRALLDRFMLVEIDPLETLQVKETLKFHSPKLSDVEINKIVDCYNKINKAHEDYTVSFNLSLRHLKMIGAMVQDGFTIYDGFYVTCKGLGSKDGLKSLESILNTTIV